MTGVNGVAASEAVNGGPSPAPEKVKRTAKNYPKSFETLVCSLQSTGSKEM